MYKDTQRRTAVQSIGALIAALAASAGGAVAQTTALSHAAPDHALVFTTSDGVRLHVTVRGEGPPCLVVHGGPGANSYLIEHFLGEALERSFTMVYLDQRGSGRSTSPADGDYSMDRMVADFEELRLALGFDRWLTLGHSFGGVLQMGYVERAQELLGLPGPPTGTLAEQLDELAGQLVERGIMWEVGFGSPETFELFGQLYAGMAKPNREFESVALTMPEYLADHRPATARVATPVLIYAGKRDWMVGPDHHQRIAFPNAMIRARETGHFPFAEPGNDVVKIISEFLTVYQIK